MVRSWWKGGMLEWILGLEVYGVVCGMFFDLWIGRVRYLMLGYRVFKFLILCVEISKLVMVLKMLLYCLFWKYKDFMFGNIVLWWFFFINEVID